MHLDIALLASPFLTDASNINATDLLDNLSARLSTLGIAHDYHDISGAHRIEVQDRVNLYSAILWRDPRPWITLCFLADKISIEGVRRELNERLVNSGEGVWLGRHTIATLARTKGISTLRIIPNEAERCTTPDAC